MQPNTTEALKRRLQRMMVARGTRRLKDFRPRTDVTPFPAGGSNAAYWKDTRPYYTGYPSGVMFAWDQYFEAILQWHAGCSAERARNGLCLFLESVDHEGFVPRTIPRRWWSQFQAQPFLCNLALLILRWENDAAWLYPEYYFRLKQYLFRWLNVCSPRGRQLSVWDHAGQTGMDNQYERAGHFHDAYCEGVDLNAYLVRELEALAELSRRGNALGLVPDESARLLDLAEQKKQAMRTWCWCDRDRMFYDYHAREKRPIRVRYGGAFAALWAGVATARQARDLVRRHLLNPDEFARPFPIPALARSEPGYHDGWLPEETLSTCSWRAHTWLPINYMTFAGLRRYGFVSEARELAARTHDLFAREPFREYYLSETGQGTGRADFLGWSGLALYMPDEWRDGIDPTEICASPLTALFSARRSSSRHSAAGVPASAGLRAF
jgi:hypothetical protein